VHGEASALGIAHQVVVDTQVDGLAHIVRADHDLRVIDHAHKALRRLPEESNRSDVVGDVGRHRRGHVQSRNPVATGAESEAVKLAAVRDALDRAGLKPPAQVELSAKEPPWMELLGDVAQITRAQHEAMKRGKPFTPAPALATRPADDGPEVVDAEIVPEQPETHPESSGERADDAGQPASRPPDFATPTHTPSCELVPLEDAAADVAQANRAARVVRVRQRR
jgi:hypothetical protein